MPSRKESALRERYMYCTILYIPEGFAPNGVRPENSMVVSKEDDVAMVVQRNETRGLQG